jgi:hypothetical protein
MPALLISIILIVVLVALLPPVLLGKAAQCEEVTAREESHSAIGSSLDDYLKSEGIYDECVKLASDESPIAREARKAAEVLQEISS